MWVVIWTSLQQPLGTKLSFNTAYHSQTDGLTDRTNQTLEDMLRACLLDFKKEWDEDCPYVSLPTKTTITPILVWHLMRHCMVKDATLR